MKFENTEVWGFKHALRGMRNPKESWNKSDSECDIVCDEDECAFNFCKNCKMTTESLYTYIGPNDLDLAQRLIKAGPEHRKFLRQIFVSVDITAPLFYFKELDIYKVGTTANSTSTMHKLATTPITIDCFETDDYCKEVTKFNDFIPLVAEDILIPFLEELRLNYLKTKDKRYWKELIRWLPESWLQKRTITMNYENVLSMIHQRKDHKLNEWSGKDNPNVPNFISWAKTLPYAKELLFICDEESCDKG